MNFLKMGAVMSVFMAVAAQSNAAMWVWTTTSMSGLEENPPNASPGSGLVTGTMDDVTGVVTLTSGTYSGLVAPITAAHIHGLAAAGTNAGVIFGLTHSGGTSGTLSGGGVLNTPARIAGFIGGLTYVNVHTSTFPGGEIRGQIHATLVPEPATLAAVGLGVVALLRRRRK